jgi:hypothetical protein
VKFAVAKGPGWNPDQSPITDALARELKLNTNGKQMLAALDKAGLV